MSAVLYLLHFAFPPILLPDLSNYVYGFIVYSQEVQKRVKY